VDARIAQARSEPAGLSLRLSLWERRDVMFSSIYDKADWGVGVLLLVAIVCAMFA